MACNGGATITAPPRPSLQVISKRKLTSPEEIDDVRREVQIMHHLAGHANVVGLKNVYEDKSNVCLVMEVCTGGELFDSIVKRGHYTEKDAAALIRTIVSVVAHCHNMGVIHRDLKVGRVEGRGLGFVRMQGSRVCGGAGV